MTGAIESARDATTPGRDATLAARHRRLARRRSDKDWISDVVRAGDLLVAAQGVGEPAGLIEDVLSSGRLPHDVELFVGLSHSGVLQYLGGLPLPLVSFGAMGSLAASAAAGALSVIPCQFSDVARLLKVRAPGRLVPLIQVSPADADGFHSLGLAVDYTYELLSAARAVVAEVNDQVPVTSAPRVHGSAFTATVRSSRPLPHVSAPRINDTHRRIAQNVSDLVPDGATIQLGVGTLPAVVGRAIAGRRGLRVHSTLAGDWLLELAVAGALSDEPGAVLISEAAGSDALYRHVLSQAVPIRPVEELMRAEVLAGIDTFVAMNSALEVDLTGQVNAEQLPKGYVGGIGGQPEFLRAAQRSPGGRSIVMLPATAGKARNSRIVPQLRGHSVTTLRSGVDFVVTEFGVADLRGKTLQQRMHAMAQIAAPEFRGDLLAP